MKNTRSADFCSDQIDVITNLAVITNAVIKRVYCNIFSLILDIFLINFQEQYEYLHHAILHALTFDCKSITGEKFIETYSRLIKKKEGKSQLEAQFQVWPRYV